MNNRPQLAVIVTGHRSCEVYYYPNWEPIFESQHKDTERLAANFQLGVDNSNSDYLVRIDADDFETIPSRFYERGIVALEDDVQVHAVSPTYRVHKDGKVVLTLITPQGAGIFYRRAQFETVNYETSLDLQADLDFWIRFTQHYRMEHRGNLIYLWGVRESRSLKNPDICLENRRKVLEKHGMTDDAVHHFGLYPYKELLCS